MTEQPYSSNTSSATDVSNRRALVISPTFFDYYKNIISEFESLGFNAIWLNTWLYQNPAYKILLRIAPSLVSKFSTAKYIRNTEALELEGVSEILVVKGEGLSIDFIRYLRRKFPRARLNLYLWDGVENTRGATQIAPAFDSVSTFDPKDARVFNWHHRPLFARNIEQTRIESTAPATYDWVFIGSLHSDRLAVLKRLAHSQAIQKFYAYGFIPGKFMWLLRHLTNPRLWRHGTIKVSTQSIPSDQVNKIIKSSVSVVDIEHPKQRGLTMRSIETLLLGRKLVTTNTEIKNSDLFHETRVFVIDRQNPKIPRNFLESPFVDIPPTIKARYYIRNWLEEVIQSQNKPPILATTNTATSDQPINSQT